MKTSRERVADYRQRRRDDGLCLEAGCQRDPKGRARCAPCRDRIAVRDRLRRDEGRKTGKDRTIERLRADYRELFDAVLADIGEVVTEGAFFEVPHGKRGTRRRPVTWESFENLMRLLRADLARVREHLEQANADYPLFHHDERAEAQQDD